MRSCLMVFVLFYVSVSSASLMEIEKHCLQMYQKKIPKVKRLTDMRVKKKK